MAIVLKHLHMDTPCDSYWGYFSQMLLIVGAPGCHSQQHLSDQEENGRKVDQKLYPNSKLYKFSPSNRSKRNLLYLYFPLTQIDVNHTYRKLFRFFMYHRRFNIKAI